MKKIPTLFVREFENHKVAGITDEFTNDKCERAFIEGTPTVKFDGSCCAVIDGTFYKRYDAKKGKPIPDGAIKCQDAADEITGHLPCWVAVDENNPADKWFCRAYKEYVNREGKIEDGTYEAVGKHFQGNPYEYNCDVLIPHGKQTCELDTRTFECVRTYLTEHSIEGIVFWLNDEPVCKIKRTDFGLQWPVK